MDRRQRRRQETIEEILTVALELMGEQGVAALSLSEVARRIGLRQPSLYQYFPSKIALYDAVFERAASRALATLREATGAAEPGLPALVAAVEAIGRSGLAEQVGTQLVFWRPVPGFEPSPAAFQPSVKFVAEIRRVLASAVDRGQLHADAASEEGVALLSILIAGMLSQQLANQPQASYEEGRYTRLTPRLLTMFIDTYAPVPSLAAASHNRREPDAGPP